MTTTLDQPTTESDANPQPAPIRFTEHVGVNRLLRAVPMRNRAVMQQQRQNQLVLSLPLIQRWWARAPLTWLFPVRQRRRFALDMLGREVWDAIDGRRSTEQITEAFAQRHNLGFHEARLSVTAFLRTLTQRHLIVLWVDDGDGSDAAPERAA